MSPAGPLTGHVAEQFETIAAMLGRQLPKVEAMMRDARDDLLAFTAFPAAALAARSGPPTPWSGSTGK